MKKLVFVESLPQQLVAEIVENHRKRLTEDGSYNRFQIEDYCESIVDCKIVDIEDSIDADLYEQVMKAAGYR